MRILRYLGLLLCLPISAQVVSNIGRFEVDYARGCAPLSINLTVLDGFGAVSRQYFYETPSSLAVTGAQTHTYTQPGTYYLVQLIGDDSAVPKTDTLRIDVFEAIVPNYELFYCENRAVQVRINDPMYDSYDVSFAGNPPSSLLDGQTINYTYGAAETLSVSVKGILTGAPDNCAENFTILPSVQDVLVAPDPTTAQITQTCEGQYDLQVTANGVTDVVYEVEWNKDNGVYSSLYQGKLTGPLVFNNIAFTSLNTDYCVRINAVNTCTNARIIGNSTCVTLPPNVLDPVQELYSTYVGNSIAIVLNPVSSGEFVFQRTFDQVNFSTINQGQSSYTDASPFLGRQYYYRVSYKDACNEVWDLQNTSPPFIRAVELETNRLEITFQEGAHSSSHSFAYEGLLTGSAGSMVIPISGSTFELKLPVSLGERQEFVISGISGGTTIYSNTLKFEFEFVVYVPKAFSPNNDGLNDRLEFFGLDGANAELKIYTRWGQQIYGELSSAPAWDGRINGHLADEGVYVYEISIPERANHRQKGTFALIKK